MKKGKFAKSGVEVIHAPGKKAGKSAAVVKYQKQIGAIEARAKASGSRASKALADLRAEPGRSLLGTALGIAGGMAVDSVIDRHLEKNPVGTLATNPMIEKAVRLIPGAALAGYGYWDGKSTLMHTGLHATSYQAGAMWGGAKPPPTPAPAVKGLDVGAPADRRARREARRQQMARQWAGKLAAENPAAVSGSESLEEHLGALLESIEGDSDVGAPASLVLTQAALNKLMPFLASLEKGQVQQAPDVSGDGMPATDAFLAVSGLDELAGDGDVGAKKRLSAQERKLSRLERKLAKQQVKVSKGESKDLVKSGKLVELLEKLSGKIEALESRLSGLEQGGGEMSMDEEPIEGSDDDISGDDDDLSGMDDDISGDDDDISGDDDDISGDDDDLSGMDFYND